MVLTRRFGAAQGGSETGARRCRDIVQGHTIEIEFDESEPTIQQQLAYERFWKLFLERILRERQLDNNT